MQHWEDSYSPLLGGSDEDAFLDDPPPRWSDQRVEWMLGALVATVVLLLVAMIVFVFVRGWPSFSANGLSWFGADGSPDEQLSAISQSGQTGGAPDYTFHAGR